MPNIGGLIKVLRPIGPAAFGAAKALGGGLVRGVRAVGSGLKGFGQSIANSRPAKYLGFAIRKIAGNTSPGEVVQTGKALKDFVGTRDGGT